MLHSVHCTTARHVVSANIRTDIDVDSLTVCWSLSVISPKLINRDVNPLYGVWSIIFFNQY